jgi:hypothetical protein
VCKNSLSKLSRQEYIFNLPGMIKIILAILLIVTGNRLPAQHLQYRDNKKPPVIKRASPIKDTAVVYHEWPDLCPGSPGTLPILTNYVPKELVLKLREIYKGHLYSITSLKVAEGERRYKLQVCVKGKTTVEYADENGNIITK